MDSPGLYSLGDFDITTAGTQTGEWVEDLDGMLAALLDWRFVYGSGGSAVKVYLQTALADDPEVPIDIACVTFGQASKHVVHNFSALAPMEGFVTPTDGAMLEDTAVDGLLGDKLRIKVVSTGLYAGSTVLSVRATVR